jgi:hypothetical protein
MLSAVPVITGTAIIFIVIVWVIPEDGGNMFS